MRNVARKVMDLFSCPDLLHHKWLEAKRRISRLDSVFIGAENSGDFVVLHQYELAFVLEERGKFPLVGLLFFFEYHCQNNRIRN